MITVYFRNGSRQAAPKLMRPLSLMLGRGRAGAAFAVFGDETKGEAPSGGGRSALSAIIAVLATELKVVIKVSFQVDDHYIAAIVPSDNKNLTKP
ncbi:MAG TPA: hypothetical protein VGC09_18175 [Rhodopila sp.]